jgi:hypothetical protein
MAPFPSPTADASLISPNPTSIPAETYVTIVFGIFAVLGTVVAAWQGRHRVLKISHHEHPLPNPDLGDTTGDNTDRPVRGDVLSRTHRQH